MAIRIKQLKHNDNIILAIYGRVAPEDTLEISKRIISLKRKKFTCAVIDLSELDYLCSQWIGVFIHTWKVLHDRGKKLVFCIPKGFIQNQFRAANLSKLFTIIESLDDL